MRRVGLAALAILLPIVVQAIWILAVGTLWVSAWDWMNALPAWWAMTIIIGPERGSGVAILCWAFRWYAAALAVVYAPVMFVVLANLTGLVARHV